jgi:CBS domain-containing protein
VSDAAQAVDKLVRQHVHRVFVVDAERRPAGVVTLTDVVRALMAQAA